MSDTDPVGVGIVGTGQRGAAYAWGIARTSGLRVAGLCDTNAERMESFARDCDLADVRRTTQLPELLTDEQVGAVFVAVPDKHHRHVAEAAFAAGKHVMLEKPMALSEADCRAIIAAKQQAGRVLQIGFILRCTPFYRKIKAIVDAGTLGQMTSISASENLGTSHSASYMRRWHRKSVNSGSFLLAKCCHDLDMLSWLIGSRPVRVASFGDNNFFLPGKQPSTHCSICPKQSSCPFRFDGGFVYMSAAEKANPSRYDFDLCVYNDDKDIIDNQVCILEYANAVRATFSLQLFHPEQSKRYITITGTEAHLTGNLEENLVRVQFVADGRVEEHDVSDEVAGGHAGGDQPALEAFVQAARTGTEASADLLDGLAGTVVGVAIEQARLTRQVVEIDPQQYRIDADQP